MTIGFTRRTLTTALAGLCLSAGLATAASAATSGKIIISGASGQLGELTIKALLAQGVSPKDLILVSRTPDKLTQYAQQGAATRYGDVEHPESLPAAYAGGTQMLFISIGKMGTNERPELHKRAFDAAVKDGVKHIVYTSFIGADTGQSGLAVDHRRSEGYLKASGAKWTMLRNGIYADMLVMQAKQMAATGQVQVRPNDGKIAYVTRADCAAAAAAALTKPGQDDKAYDITGSEAIGSADLARIVGDITGKPIAVTQAAAGGGPGGAGAPGAGAPGAAPSGASGPPPGGGGPMAPPTVTTAVKDLTGRAPTSVHDLLVADRAQWDSGAH